MIKTMLSIVKQMWSHYCQKERCFIETEIGRPCNWCEKTENDKE
jgi:hypothetical protein